jgi:hypothetical protein
MSDTAQTGASTPNLFSSPTTTLVRKAARWLGLCRLYSSANKQQAGPVVGVFSCVSVAAGALPLSRSEP